MSWIGDLYETYELNFDLDRLDFTTGKMPLPISHTTQNAQIEVTLDETGDFIHAEAIGDKENAPTIIPVSEDSAARTSGACAHPLADKLEYIAGDFEQYTGKNNDEKHQLYREALSDWCDSAYSCAEIEAVCSYIAKGSVVRDLASCGVLKVTEEGGLSSDKIAGIDQRESFVRFSVSGGNPDALYRNKRVMDLYVRYYQALGGDQDLCCVTGDYSVCSQKHGRNIRYGGDGAKLISSNDSRGFTYRGRFSEPSQAVSIGYDVSQKAHSALRWLIKKNGFSAGEMKIVAWEISGKEIPNIMTEQIIDPFGGGTDEDGIEPSYEGGNGSTINRQYAVKLRKTVNGYRKDLGDNSNIVVMGLESAMPGKGGLSIRFYSKMNGSDFLDNIEYWCSSCCWRWGKYVGTPAPMQIAKAAFGARNDKLLGNTAERLLPCIVARQPIPQDIVRASVNAASNPNSFEKSWEWDRAVGIACALIRKMHYDRSGNRNGEDRKEWSMALDREERDRSYLFGRLLGAARKIEEMALFFAGESSRTTNAEKYYQQFGQRPLQTWRVIDRNLQPYLDRLKNRNVFKYEKALREIYDLITPEQFQDNRALSELYMLGYNCQYNSYKENKEEEQDVEQ